MSNFSIDRKLLEPQASYSKSRLAIAIIASCALHVLLFAVFAPSSLRFWSSKPQVRGNGLVVKARFVPVDKSLVAVPSQRKSPNTEKATVPAQALPEANKPEEREESEATGAPGPANANGYWPAESLDTQPAVVEDIPLDMPELRGRTESGTIVLSLFINAAGAVDDVVVETSDLPDIFAELVRRDFLKARFNPGLRDAEPVASTMRVEVTIRPDGQK